MTPAKLAALDARLDDYAAAKRVAAGLDPIAEANLEYLAARAQVPVTQAAAARRKAKLEALRRAGRLDEHRDEWVVEQREVPDET